MKYMERYNVAYNAFEDLVKQIRFMPNTKKISADIVAEIAKVEKAGQLAYEAIVNQSANAVEGATQAQEIKA